MKVYLRDLKVKFTELTGVVAKAKEVREYLTNLGVSHLYNHQDFRRKSTWQQLVYEVEWSPQRLIKQVHGSTILEQLTNFPVSCRQWLLDFFKYITQGHNVSSDDPEIIQLFYPNWKPDPNKAEYLANLKKRIFSLRIGTVIKLLTIGYENLPNCPTPLNKEYFCGPMDSRPWAPKWTGYVGGRFTDYEKYILC